MVARFFRDVADRDVVEKLLTGPEPHAASLHFWTLKYDIPPDTLEKLLAGGAGPRHFLIGRRRYVLRTDWHAWLDALAERGGVSVSQGKYAAAPMRRREKTSSVFGSSQRRARGLRKAAAWEQPEEAPPP